MKLTDLIKKADEEYEGWLGLYFDPETGKPDKGGDDALARFIVEELNNHYQADDSDYEQLREARLALEDAAENLSRIAEKLK